MSQFDQGLCKHRIKASYHEFRAKEKVIADYIMEHPEKITALQKRFTDLHQNLRDAAAKDIAEKVLAVASKC